MRTPLQQARKTYILSLVRMGLLYGFLLMAVWIGGIFWQEVIAAILISGIAIVISLADYKNIVNKYNKAKSYNEKLLGRRIIYKEK